MILGRIQRIEQSLRDFVADHFDIRLDRLVVEAPPNPTLGDLAFPLAFELAKSLRRPPRKIAEELSEAIPLFPGVERFEAAGAGYVNCFFERADFLGDFDSWVREPDAPGPGGSIIVEHTNINPNKAAHIGHLRNAVMGDTFVRVLRSTGRKVEVQNYIDNTGVQVADVVIGFTHLQQLDLDQVAKIGEPFDYYCWDLYAHVAQWLREDEERLGLREAVLAQIEEGGNPIAELAEHVANRIVSAHLATMDRLGIRYDVLPRESEILHLNFWEQAYQLLKEREAIYFVEQGPHAGCWVMSLPEQDGQPADEKIIVRSNGTVTYVGKDIAYQMWKFGLLGRDFLYRIFETYQDGQPVWVSTNQEGADGSPGFGGADQVYNVIDVRQSYLQRVVIQGLRNLGFDEQADNSTHFSYEMVALSPVACRELGIALSPEDEAKSFVEMSGRKGLGVKADDLIDKLIEKSQQEVAVRQAHLDVETRKDIAHKIAIGALRYFLLKYTRTSVIAFDFGEALSFEGETGPYILYSVVRANNIFRKLREAGFEWSHEEWVGCLRRGTFGPYLGEDSTWEMLLLCGRTEEVVERSIESLEVSHLARHAFQQAQLFNLFYHRCHILSRTDPKEKLFLVGVADVVRASLLRMLGILGIEAPERM